MDFQKIPIYSQCINDVAIGDFTFIRIFTPDEPENEKLLCKSIWKWQDKYHFGAGNLPRVPWPNIGNRKGVARMVGWAMNGCHIKWGDISAHRVGRIEKTF